MDLKKATKHELTVEVQRLRALLEKIRASDPRAILLEQLRATQKEMGEVRDKMRRQMDEFTVLTDENEDVEDAVNDINDGIERMSQWI